MLSELAIRIGDDEFAAVIEGKIRLSALSYQRCGLAASIAGDSRSWRFWFKLVGVWARIFIFLKLALLLMDKASFLSMQARKQLI
jgi:hypothetical protein